MKAHELQVDAHKARKRVGRGISAGQGKTAGRGTKGQKARTGKKLNATFMGGQGALVRRIPKLKGFKSMRVPAQVVYTDMLSEVKGTATNMSLFEAGLVSSPFHAVKVILRGEVTGKVDLKVQAVSKNALEAITKAGGSFEKVEVPHLPASKKKEKTEDKPEKKA
ncbi:MAG TPA: 50S ribosomal protein L15 [Candidatus Saccharimonadales bacterium]|nr:50S ribosomal protein L15 [Candidatus Saccharimonadales bacterium]